MSDHADAALPIQAPFFHHVEFQSSHARLLTSALSNALGMPLVGTLETEQGISYCLQSHQTLILCSSPKTHSNPSSPSSGNSFHAGLKRTEGIHVHAIGINVTDEEAAYAHLSSTLHEPGESLQRHDSGSIDVHLPKLLGRLSLRFLSSDLHATSSAQSGIPNGMKGFTPCAPDKANQSSSFLPGGITSIDHIAVNVSDVSQVSQRLRSLTAWAPFRVFDEAALHRPLSALTLSSSTCEGLMTIVQPTNKSSIFEHALQANGGTYVHHIALRCADILQLADALSARGAWQSMPPPAASYYEEIRSTALDFLTLSAFEKLQHYGMLLDFEENCALVQVFLPYIDDVPGVFFELISRVPRLNEAHHHTPAAGCGGFGDRNVAQLYDCLIRGISQLPPAINLHAEHQKSALLPALGSLASEDQSHASQAAVAELIES